MAPDMPTSVPWLSPLPPAVALLPSESLHSFLVFPRSSLGSLQRPSRFHGPPGYYLSMAQAPECSILSVLQVTVPPVHPSKWVPHQNTASLSPSQQSKRINSMIPILLKTEHQKDEVTSTNHTAYWVAIPGLDPRVAFPHFHGHSIGTRASRPKASQVTEPRGRGWGRGWGEHCHPTQQRESRVSRSVQTFPTKGHIANIFLPPCVILLLPPLLSSVITAWKQP